MLVRDWNGRPIYAKRKVRNSHLLSKLYLLPLLAIPAAGAMQAQTITVYPGPATIAVGTVRNLSAYVPLSPNTIQ